MRIGRFALSFAVTGLVTASIGGAEEYERFDEVDYIVTQDVSRFAELLESARERVVRIALLGDSQETAPGGGGRVYMPRLNFEASKFFGNAPETLIEPVSSFDQAWLMRSAMLKGEVVDLGDRALPDIRCMRVPAEGYTYLMMLQPDGSGLAPGTLVEGETVPFQAGGEVKAEIFALDGNIRYEAQPVDSDQPNYFQKTTTSGVLEVSAVSDTEIQTGKTEALDFDNKSHLQLKISSADPAEPATIIGARFLNATHPYGLVINDFSAGGYRLANLLLSHRDAGDMYRAFGFDAAILHLGANDSGSVSAADFKKQTEEVIAMIREWTGDPEYKIILMGEPDAKTRGAGTPQRAQFDQYPGAQVAIAREDENVLVINSRRIVDEKLEWRLGSPKLDGYLFDQVHYSPDGARELAIAEMAVLLGIVKD